MPRPQLQFMNFYAHLSSVPGLPNCSYANELQRVFSSLSSPSSHPSKKGLQQSSVGRGGGGGAAAMSSALRMCIAQKEEEEMCLIIALH